MGLPVSADVDANFLPTPTALGLWVQRFGLSFRKTWFAVMIRRQKM